MTSEPRLPGEPPSAGDLATPTGPDADGPSGGERLWRPDTGADGAPQPRPPAARRLRAGCWVLIVVLLLLCCVLGAWLGDTVLDLRAVTTGN